MKKKSKKQKEEPIFFRMAYIKLPPMKTFTLEQGKALGYLTSRDLEPLLTGPWLESKYEKFKGTKNPISPMEAFVVAMEAGIFPPLWVLNHIAGVFKELHDSQGTKSLDELFGFFGRNSRTKIFKGLKIKHRDEELCYDLHKLTRFFKIERLEAANMIIGRLLENEEFHETPFQVYLFSPEKLVEIYYKRYKKKLDKLNKHFKKVTKKQKQAYLKHFPKDLIPTNLH